MRPKGLVMDDRVSQRLDQRFQSYLQLRGWDRCVLECPVRDRPVEAGGNGIPRGIVVVGNSDCWQYSAGLEALRDRGSGRINFFGPGPALLRESCSSELQQRPRIDL